MQIEIDFAGKTAVSSSGPLPVELAPALATAGVSPLPGSTCGQWAARSKTRKPRASPRAIPAVLTLGRCATPPPPVGVRMPAAPGLTARSQVYLTRTRIRFRQASPPLRPAASACLRVRNPPQAAGRPEAPSDLRSGEVHAAGILSSRRGKFTRREGPCRVG